MNELAALSDYLIFGKLLSHLSVFMSLAYAFKFQLFCNWYFLYRRLREAMKSKDVQEGEVRMFMGEAMNVELLLLFSIHLKPGRQL